MDTLSRMAVYLQTGQDDEDDLVPVWWLPYTDRWPSPRWHAWASGNRLYARKMGTSPPQVFGGGSVEEVVKKIKDYEGI